LEVNTAVREKYNTCPEGEPKAPLGAFNKEQNSKQSEFVPGFNVTLGQKESLLNMMER